MAGIKVEERERASAQNRERRMINAVRASYTHTRPPTHLLEQERKKGPGKK